MQCPHCRVAIHPDFKTTIVGVEAGQKDLPTVGVKLKTPATWGVFYMECPACHEAIMLLGYTIGGNFREKKFIYPAAPTRQRAPQEVPPDLAEDFNEACLVLNDSPKASAALSRRCLQGVLRDKGFNQKDLSKAIDAVLASKQLPSGVVDNLDAIRNIGNFAAHPTKDSNSGLITTVEPEEAEWNLDVLDELFDFYYVQPEKAKQKRADLNKKLEAAGKPPMKS